MYFFLIVAPREHGRETPSTWCWFLHNWKLSRNPWRTGRAVIQIPHTVPNPKGGNMFATRGSWTATNLNSADETFQVFLDVSQNYFNYIRDSRRYANTTLKTCTLLRNLHDHRLLSVIGMTFFPRIYERVKVIPQEYRLSVLPPLSTLMAKIIQSGLVTYFGNGGIVGTKDNGIFDGGVQRSLIYPDGLLKCLLFSAQKRFLTAGRQSDCGNVLHLPDDALFSCEQT